MSWLSDPQHPGLSPAQQRACRAIGLWSDTGLSPHVCALSYRKAQLAAGLDPKREFLEQQAEAAQKRREAEAAQKQLDEEDAKLKKRARQRTVVTRNPPSRHKPQTENIVPDIWIDYGPWTRIGDFAMVHLSLQEIDQIEARIDNEADCPHEWCVSPKPGWERGGWLREIS